MKLVERQWILYFYHLGNTTVIIIVNTLLNRSAALLVSIINWTYCSWKWHLSNPTIRPEIWLEPDLTRFPKKWPDCGFAEPKPKSGTTVNKMLSNCQNFHSFFIVKQSVQTLCQWSADIMPILASDCLCTQPVYSVLVPLCVMCNNINFMWHKTNN